jgi:cold shock CspA family protein
MPELTVGTVLFYDPIRGFGFLKCDRGPDVFISKSELLDSGIANLSAGMRLAFRLQHDPRGRNPWASNIRRASEVPA